MHMQGNPITMQKNPQYDNSLLDVFDYLQWRFSVCLKAGLLPENLIVDPGIGFGKNNDHNLSILRRLSLFHSLGAPILLGASRKSLIAGLSNGESANERLPGSLTIGLLAADQGVQILRVHDVAETKQAFLVKRALNDRF
jgi:dihydropteroate synthase